MPASYGFLSTFPPTECGLATFTAALLAELRDGPPACEVGVVRLSDGNSPGRPGGTVVHHLSAATPGGESEAAAALSEFDVVIAQHEYGIYGGRDGDQILAVLDEVRVPVIVVLHTVLVDPTPHQRAVLEQVVAAAGAVVTMTPTARRRLLSGYQVDPRRVALIPHGAADNRLPASAAPRVTGSRPTILTWGLIGPGKGIEWAIDALAELSQDRSSPGGSSGLEVTPRYLVVGETHPKVVEREGEAYRDALRARAAAHGIAHLVEFYDRYLDLSALGRVVQEADVVLLPYDSREQVTSGVLVEALAAGKPVIATGFPHAVELLGGGAGLVVPHGDAPAMASALRRVLTEPGLSARLGREAAALAPQLLWPAVADRYRSLAATVVGTRTAAVA